MEVRSNSFGNGQTFPVEFAAGQVTDQGVGFAPNRNPHLAWTDVPDGTRSFVVLCVDPDVPTVAEMVGKAGVEIPRDQVRTEFNHWVMVDIGRDVRDIAAGSCSDGVVKHGKKAPAGPPGARQGLNDYTGWFAEDPDMSGDWFGYDGPFPPPNDLRVHRYFFRVFALDVQTLTLPAMFVAADVLRAMRGHLLGEAAIHATYSLHPSPVG